jgi:heat shock protein HslJ
VDMIKACIAVLALTACVLPARAEDPQLICFGNEPSWGLEFAGRGSARLVVPDLRPVYFRGSETRLDVLKEWAWRGKVAGGKGGNLVAFLREAVCSDGMSDVKHPVTARVSLPDGRFLAGCCRIPPARNAMAAPAATIEGSTWKLVGLPGHDSSALGGAKRPVTARFEAGRISGFSGCNRFMGGYTVDRDKLAIGTLAGTMMACPGPEMALESAFQRALAGTFRFAISDDRLTLTPASGAPLVFQMAPAPRLEGVTWEVTGFNNGRQAVVGALSGTRLTLSFQDGMVQGHSGCNTFRATFKRDGDRLAIGPAAVTRMACAGDGVMQQEREFLAALETTTLWTIQDGMLDMHRADGERVLTANQVAR